MWEWRRPVPVGASAFVIFRRWWMVEGRREPGVGPWVGDARACDGRRTAVSPTYLLMYSLLSRRVGTAAFGLLGLTVLLLAPVRAEAQRGARPTRVAVIDSRVIIDSLPERVAAQRQFDDEQAVLRRRVQQASDSLKWFVEEFSRQEQQLSPRQREASMLLLKARELQLEEFVAQLDAGVLNRAEELRQPMRERVRDAVRAVREAGGYDLVIDRASTAGVVDAAPGIDITAQVIARLRAARP